MKLILIALAFALLTACYSVVVSARGQPQRRIGAYYNDANCGSGVGHVLKEKQKSPIVFSAEQGAPSVRMDSTGFTIYKDQGCTQAARSQGAGGCADFGGQLIRCIKYSNLSTCSQIV